VNFTKTPYLVLFVVLGSVAIGTATAVGTITLAGTVNMDNNQITNLADPSVSSDAATKNYVDSQDHHARYTNSEAVSAVGPHTVDTDTLAGLGCTINQIAKWNGASWVCAEDSDTTTTVGKIINTVDASANDVGKWSSIAIGTDGNPVISYYDATATSLKVAHCNDPACNSSSKTVVDNAGNVGRFSSIAIGKDGFPVISYHHVGVPIPPPPGNLGLKFVRCTSIACTTHAPALTLDGGQFNGQFTSLVIDSDGVPAISYYDGSPQNLKLFICDDFECGPNEGAGTGTAINLDITADAGKHSSMALGADRFLVISYYDVNAANLKTAHCNGIPCAGFNLQIIDGGGNVGQWSSIAIGTDGNPVISYYDATGTRLRVAHCETPNCTTFNNPKPIVDDFDFVGIDVGRFSSMEIGPRGFPVISYYDDTNGDLKVAHCNNHVCSSATLTSVYTTGGVGQHTSMAIGEDGHAVISYYDVDNGNLKVLKFGGQK